MHKFVLIVICSILQSVLPSFRFQVVDMFGCGLPVAAKSCPALHELVINGINGMIFDSSEELAKQVSYLNHFWVNGS